MCFHNLHLDPLGATDTHFRKLSLGTGKSLAASFPKPELCLLQPSLNRGLWTPTTHNNLNNTLLRRILRKGKIESCSYSFCVSWDQLAWTVVVFHSHKVAHIVNKVSEGWPGRSQLQEIRDPFLGSPCAFLSTRTMLLILFSLVFSPSVLMAVQLLPFSSFPCPTGCSSCLLTSSYSHFTVVTKSSRCFLLYETQGMITLMFWRDDSLNISGKHTPRQVGKKRS